MDRNKIISFFQLKFSTFGLKENSRTELALP